jgi:amidase
LSLALSHTKVLCARVRTEIMANVDKICDYVRGTKVGLPGMDIIIFPEYSTQVCLLPRLLPTSLAPCC